MKIIKVSINSRLKIIIYIEYGSLNKLNENALYLEGWVKAKI